MKISSLSLLAGGLLVLLVLIIFWPVQWYDFIQYDDQAYITSNFHVQTGITRASFIWAFTTNEAGFWQPLTWLSLMGDYGLYGLHAGGYHWTNVLLHAGSALLLFLSLQAMTGALWRSFFVAALFAVHPLHVESVAWIAERKDVLSTFFWALAMLFYASYAVRGGMGRYLLVFVSFVLGLMAKPMLVTLPFVLLLLDWWPLSRFQKGASLYRLVGEKIPFIVFSAVFSLVTYRAEQQTGALPSLAFFSMGQRVANALVSYVSYIGKMIWPTNLAIFYPHPGTWPLWQVIGSGLVLVAITTAVFALLMRKYPYFLTGWLWYLGTLVPVIGLVQVGEHSMADRYTYVPLIGLFIIASWGGFDLFRRYRYGMSVLPFLAVTVVCVLVACSWKQVRYWENAETIFRHAIGVTQNNYLAHNNLGAALARQDKIEQAKNHYRQALLIKPRYAHAWFNMGAALADQGKWGEAIQYYATSLQINPHFAEAWNNMGIALARQGKLDNAIHYFHAAVQMNPGYRAAENNLRIAQEEKTSGKKRLP